jgi:hypothetical protein
LKVDPPQSKQPALSFRNDTENGGRLTSVSTPLLSTATSENTPPLAQIYDKESVPDVVTRTGKTPSLLRTLIIVFGPKMAVGHLCKLFADVLTFAGPLLQR